MPWQCDEKKCQPRSEPHSSTYACPGPTAERIDDGEERFGPTGCRLKPRAEVPTASNATIDHELDHVMHWLEGLNKNKRADNHAEASVPASSSCSMPSGKVCFAKPPVWIEKGPEIGSAVHRMTVTGRVARSVCYGEGEFPGWDILGLRGGLGEPVIVTRLLKDGAAERARVHCGYELASVNGEKDILQYSAHEILKRLTAPTTLVFMGFLGKFPAEVRLMQKDGPIGMRPKEAVVAPAEEVQLLDEVVFNPGHAPLFLSGIYPHAEEEAPSSSTPLYELRGVEARGILASALQPLGDLHRYHEPAVMTQVQEGRSRSTSPLRPRESRDQGFCQDAHQNFAFYEAATEPASTQKPSAKVRPDRTQQWMSASPDLDAQQPRADAGTAARREEPGGTTVVQEQDYLITTL